MFGNGTRHCPDTQFRTSSPPQGATYALKNSLRRGGGAGRTTHPPPPARGSPDHPPPPSYISIQPCPSPHGFPHGLKTQHRAPHTPPIPYQHFQNAVQLRTSPLPNSKSPTNNRVGVRLWVQLYFLDPQRGSVIRSLVFLVLQSLQKRRARLLGRSFAPSWWLSYLDPAR